MLEDVDDLNPLPVAFEFSMSNPEGVQVIIKNKRL
jgi:hypothetical protein